MRATTTLARLLGGRFTALTLVLLALALFVGFIGERRAYDLGAAIGFSVLVLFAIRITGRGFRIVTVALAVPAFAGYWNLQFSDWFPARVAGFGLVSLFLGFLTLVILGAVFRHEIVTADTIVGAICAYVLLGVTWGTVYALVILLSPGSLAISPALVRAAVWDDRVMPLTPLLQYYSFTTLATIGYGDISPIGHAARVLSVLEGMTGQLYLAVLIARLVGLHTARKS